MQSSLHKHRSSLKSTSTHTITERKSVRFSGVIGFSDNQIGFLDYEDDDILSTCSSCDESDPCDDFEEERWSLDTQLPPSAPMRRRSFLDSDAVPTDPPSPPLRRRSIVETDMPQSIIDYVTDDDDDLSEAEDDSIVDSMRFDGSFAPGAKCPTRRSSWAPFVSRKSGNYFPPAMPKRKISGNGTPKRRAIR